MSMRHFAPGFGAFPTSDHLQCGWSAYLGLADGPDGLHPARMIARIMATRIVRAILQIVVIVIHPPMLDPKRVNEG